MAAMDEPHEPFNPYQAPESDAFAQQDDPRPENVFGLAHPIHAEGTLTAEDIRRSYESTPRENITAIFWLTVIVVLLIVQVASGSMSAVWIALFATIFAAVLLILLVGRLPCFKRRADQRIEENATFERSTFSEDQLLVETEQGRFTWRWPAFSKCRCLGQTVLLYVQHNGYSMLLLRESQLPQIRFVPRSFFTDEDAWQEILRLVRENLPEKEVSCVSA